MWPKHPTLRILIRGNKLKEILGEILSAPVFVCLFVFAVLGLELKGLTLSHSTSPIFVEIFSR
jgi:hypothetical protein